MSDTYLRLERGNGKPIAEKSPKSLAGGEIRLSLTTQT
jgi:hypothetical protein